MTDALLKIALSASVPLWIAEHQNTAMDDRIARAKVLAQIVAEHGDDIQFRSKKKGATSEAFNALAEGIAIASFMPGGITAFGEHWESE